MLIKALYDYGIANLPPTEHLEEKSIHFSLMLDTRGRPSRWHRHTTEVDNGKGKTKVIIGREYLMPAAIGVKNGGKADFLSEYAAKVIGIDEEGNVLPDTQPKGAGRGDFLAFAHFWQQISDAKDADPAMESLLKFHAQHISTAELRREFLQSGIISIRKGILHAFDGQEWHPLKTSRLSFMVGGLPVFQRGGPIHEHWMLAAAEAGDQTPTLGNAVCSITGVYGPIVASHNPLIKGVPTMSMGGRLIAVKEKAGAYEAYGMTGAMNSPLSVHAVSTYTRALNALIDDKKTCRVYHKQELVVLGWVKSDPGLSSAVNDTLDRPTPDATRSLMESLDAGTRTPGIMEDRYWSVVLGANAGRVVVRRCSSLGMAELRDNLKAWYDDLEIETGNFKVERPYRSLWSMQQVVAQPLQGSGDREELAPVQWTVVNELLRAALDGSCPSGLLPLAVLRASRAVVKRGREILWEPQRAALVRLINNRLVRSRAGGGLVIPSKLFECEDAPYNCGRAVAILYVIQRKSAGRDQPASNVLSRFYGRASTCPAMVLPSMMTLANSHLAKLKSADWWRSKLARVMALIPAGKDGKPGLPRYMGVEEQGRFLLGFYQQLAEEMPFREKKEEDAAAVVEEPEAVSEELEFAEAS